MKSGTQVAVAVGTGYLLGRRRKMKLAAMIGGAAVAGGIGGIGGQLMRRGAKLVGSADLLGKVFPELSEISDVICNDLLDAGKGAARTAVNSRIDSLSDRLRDRAEAWRNPGETVRGTAETARGAVGLGRGGDKEDEEFAEDQETEEASANDRARRGACPAPDEPADEYEEEEEDDDDDEGDEEEVMVPARRPRRTARSADSGAPIRRTRR